ncbi:MAG TPA: RusA family crossover junction endodeoxyribonuclease [Steroidobacteraceae bacterium]|nr:RusA family crossover junction endodeoxyribonuclease [Steroidobacteraceae bacterium]
MSRALTLKLPWPPSVNHYWLILRRGKLAGQPIISDAGKAYRKRVGQLVLEHEIPRNALHGRLAVEILARPPDLRARDLDNLPKGVLDSLTHAGVIRDDSDIDDLRIRRGPKIAGGMLDVAITVIPGMATTSGYLFDKEEARA